MAHYATFTLAGKIAAIFDSKVLTRGITYTEVLIETAADKDKFSNAVIVSFYGDDAEQLKDYEQGNMVEVSGQVQGRYYDKTNRYYTTLAADSITRA